MGDLDRRVVLVTDTKAVAVDIGGPLSHRAIVARSIDVPCSIGNGNGGDVTRRRLEGDRILDHARGVCS